MVKPIKKVELVFNYASPDPERDNKILIQVAKYFAREIKQKEAACAKSPN